jgi:hypothetical protein
VVALSWFAFAGCLAGLGPSPQSQTPLSDADLASVVSALRGADRAPMLARLGAEGMIASHMSSDNRAWLELLGLLRDCVRSGAASERVTCAHAFARLPLWMPRFVGDGKVRAVADDACDALVALVPADAEAAGQALTALRPRRAQTIAALVRAIDKGRVRWDEHQLGALLRALVFAGDQPAALAEVARFVSDPVPKRAQAAARDLVAMLRIAGAGHAAAVLPALCAIARMGPAARPLQPDLAALERGAADAPELLRVLRCARSSAELTAADCSACARH